VLASAVASALGSSQAMTFHLVILGTFLAVAAAFDVAQRRVPNLVVAPLAAAGLAARWLLEGPAAAGDGLLAGIAVLAVLAYPWARRYLGAGDVKLAAAAAIWLGLGSVAPFLLYAGAAGIPVALAAKLSHRLALAQVARAPGGAPPGDAPLVSPGTAPVAVAIALGALAVLWVRP
jgi:prepilin peptidase CpaA